MVIEGYSSDELSVAIEAMIDKDATIITDKWKAYSKAVGERKHIALLSDKGMSMPEIHLVIFNLKNWIRGTHHKVSKSHLQDYLNEYFYRFNNRNLLNRISIRILKLMTKHPEIPYKSLVAA